ncbi:hypothetical protein NMW35_11055, partial [Pasteurella multocida]|nr:hypothetical protein [Pasteurella multocida]
FAHYPSIYCTLSVHISSKNHQKNIIKSNIYAKKNLAKRFKNNYLKKENDRHAQKPVDNHKFLSALAVFSSSFFC